MTLPSSIRAFTLLDSNKIAILQNHSAKWFDMLSQVAGNHELAALVVKAQSGEELDRVEAQQYRAYVLQRLNLSNHMLSIYDEELISEDEVRGAFRAIRTMANTPRFRQVIETIDSPRLRALILDEDGLDRYLKGSEME